MFKFKFRQSYFEKKLNIFEILKSKIKFHLICMLPQKRVNMSRLQDYDVLEIMGTGSYGTCFKVKNKLTEKLFVWKAIDYGGMNEDTKNNLITEINLLKQFNHPHIVQYFNHIVNKETETLYIIMECCDGGDLYHWIKRCKTEKCHFEEEFIWRALYQLSKAIQGCHLHKHKIVVLHRDIKPANVFLDSVGNIKLGDFGLSRALGQNHHRMVHDSMADTTFYMSSEAIRDEKYRRKSDIWSLGGLIYELCTLSQPHRSKQHSNGQKCSGNQYKTIPKWYSNDLEKIIGFMLAMDHGYRPTVEVILHHPTVLTNLLRTKSCIPILIPDAVSVPNTMSSPDLPSADTIAADFCESNTTQSLRRDLFATSSPKRKLQSHTSGCSSEPEQPTESKRSTPITSKAASDFMTSKFHNPESIAKEVFNQAFKLRLKAIKDRETDLCQREKEMKQREQMLVRRERERHTKEKLPSKNRQRRSSITISTGRNGFERDQWTNGNRRQFSNVHEASYESIESNDIMVVPTTAKLDLDRLYRPKTFEKKVSFHRAPSQLTNYNIENVPPATSATISAAVPRSSGPKGKEEKAKRCSSVGRPSKNSAPLEQGKRKSFFSIFSLNLNHLKKHAPTADNKASKKADTKMEKNKQMEEDASLPEVLPNKWTQETKRTAFEMLAIMNAADGINDSQSTIVDSIVVNDKIIRHDRKRQSMVVLKR